MNIFTVNNNSLISSYKTLNFYDNLPELVLSGEKTTTWRINDDKDIKK